MWAPEVEFKPHFGDDLRNAESRYFYKQPTKNTLHQSNYFSHTLIFRQSQSLMF